MHEGDTITTYLGTGVIGRMHHGRIPVRYSNGETWTYPPAGLRAAIASHRLTVRAQARDAAALIHGA